MEEGVGKNAYVSLLFAYQQIDLKYYKMLPVDALYRSRLTCGVKENPCGAVLAALKANPADGGGLIALTFCDDTGG